MSYGKPLQKWTWWIGQHSVETSAIDWKKWHSWNIACLKLQGHVSSYWIYTKTGHKILGRRNSHIGVKFQCVMPKWTFYCSFQDKGVWSGLCRKHHLLYCVHRQWLWLQLKENVLGCLIYQLGGASPLFIWLWEHFWMSSYPEIG